MIKQLTQKFKLLGLVAFGLMLFSFKCSNIATASPSDNISIEELLANEEKKTMLQSPEKKKAILEVMQMMIAEGHYAPQVINEKYGEEVYDKFLERMDYGKAFFTQEDIKVFEKNKKDIDDQLQEGQLDFYTLVTNTYYKRLKEVKGYYDELIKTPQTFDKDESIQLDGKKSKFVKSSTELKDKWRQSIKYRVLAKYAELREEQSYKKDTVKDWKVMSDAVLEDSARRVVKKNLDYYFRKIQKNGDDEFFSSFVNAISTNLDPHTDFFAPKEKQKFDEQMSGTFYGIGASLQSKDDACIVNQVISGSPAWKTGKLKADDKIMRVAQGEDEPVEITGWDIDDIVQIIRGKKGTTVRLFVKHKDGSEEIIPIVRDEVHQEEVFAKSAVFQDGNKKIGFIYLPEFYADFQKQDGKRCAVDMRKEVLKLKDEGVDGMIIDLRYNGGGSLSDVVDIAGLFVGNGPVVQVKSRYGNNETLKARDRAPIYEGPLAIMINNGSASASEILAGALQDYKRAVIVGNSSFGKGTVQRVFDMDQAYNGLKNKPSVDVKPLGSLKMTVQKFYRVSGNSTQLQGVVPDVKLPDLFMYLEGGERRDKKALPWDMIEKSDYSALNSLELKTVTEKSAARIKSNPIFNLIEDRAKQIKKQSDDNVYSLNLTKYLAQIAEAKAFGKKLEELDKTKELFDAYNCKADMDRVIADDVSKKKNEDWLKSLKKDVNIKETVNILKDIIG
jgi:carboxyl-terminal processing protease